MMQGMVIDMNDEQLRTLADLQVFLTRIVALDFMVAADDTNSSHASYDVSAMPR